MCGGGGGGGGRGGRGGRQAERQSETERVIHRDRMQARERQRQTGRDKFDVAIKLVRTR